MQRLSNIHPEIEKRFFDVFSSHLARDKSRAEMTRRITQYIDQIIDFAPPQKIAVIGCGPMPTTIQELSRLNYEVLGVEPVKAYVENANQYLNGAAVVKQGTCESVPCEAEAVNVIFCESVLEHVDSPERSLNEFFRILKPGGVVYITTTNKLRFSLTGQNFEYRIPFYNWFPDSVKEGYVNLHLNHSPHLANYSPIPAVHWFTYASLCRLGRYAGFAKFYSLMDVMDDSDPRFRRYPFGKAVLKWSRNRPWLRAFLLRQFGGTIFMYKRR